MAAETGQIDQLDVKLMEALREDPRVGLLEIARRVGVARGTVQARLRKVAARGAPRPVVLCDPRVLLRRAEPGPAGRGRGGGPGGARGARGRRRQRRSG